MTSLPLSLQPQRSRPGSRLQSPAWWISSVRRRTPHRRRTSRAAILASQSACLGFVVHRLINAIPPPLLLLLVVAARRSLAGSGRSWRRQTNKMAEQRTDRTDWSSRLTLATSCRLAWVRRRAMAIRRTVRRRWTGKNSVTRSGSVRAAVRAYYTIIAAARDDVNESGTRLRRHRRVFHSGTRCDDISSTASLTDEDLRSASTAVQSVTMSWNKPWHNLSLSPSCQLWSYRGIARQTMSSLLLLPQTTRHRS